MPLNPSVSSLKYDSFQFYIFGLSFRRAIQFIPYLLIILLAFFLILFPFMPHLDHLAMKSQCTNQPLSDEISMDGANSHEEPSSNQQ